MNSNLQQPGFELRFQYLSDVPFDRSRTAEGNVRASCAMASVASESMAKSSVIAR